MPLRSGWLMSRTSCRSSSLFPASPAAVMGPASARISFKPWRKMAWSSTINTRIIAASRRVTAARVRQLFAVERNAQQHARAVPLQSEHVDMPAERTRALDHAANAERALLAHVFAAEAGAVVGHLQADEMSVALELGLDARSAGMPRHVV